MQLQRNSPMGVTGACRRHHGGCGQRHRLDLHTGPSSGSRGRPPDPAHQGQGPPESDHQHVVMRRSPWRKGRTRLALTAWRRRIAGFGRFQQVQAQAVGHHDNRRGGHGNGGDEWVQLAGHGQRHGEDIVDDGEARSSAARCGPCALRDAMGEAHGRQSCRG